jgi:hypothetical protein
MTLHAPGSATALGTPATVRPGEQNATVTYMAQAGDLVAPGEWVCSIKNLSNADLGLQTTITYPGGEVLREESGTFDVGLLNILIAEAVRVAGLRVHLGSRAVSLLASDALLALLARDNPLLAFPIGDIGIGGYTIGVQEIADDLIPQLAVDVGQTGQYPVATVSASLPVPDRIVATGVPFGIDAHADVGWLDATVEVDFGGNVQITPSVSASLTIAGASFDISSLLEGFVSPAAVAAALASAHLGPDAIRPIIDNFFIKLMRLGPGAVVRRYQASDTLLTVDYAYPPHPVGPPETGAPLDVTARSNPPGLAIGQQ